MGPTIETLNDLAAAWSGSLLRATWQGGLVIAAAWVLVRCRPGLPPRVACWAWRLADLKLIVALFWALRCWCPCCPRLRCRDRSPRRPSGPRPSPVPADGSEPIAAPAGEPARTPRSLDRVSPAWCWCSGWPGSSARRSWREGSGSIRRPPAAVLPAGRWPRPASRDHRPGPRPRPAERPRAADGTAVARPMLVGAFRPAILLPVAMLRRAAIDRRDPAGPGP